MVAAERVGMTFGVLAAVNIFSAQEFWLVQVPRLAFEGDIKRNSADLFDFYPNAGEEQNNEEIRLNNSP